MFTTRPDQRYLSAWIKRAGRNLSTSGQLSQTALILSKSEHGTQADWERKLRAIVSGEEVPSLELLTRVDSLLAPAKKAEPDRNETQSDLF